MDQLQLWGGHECTVNRVGNVYFDQTKRTGHEHRIGDLDLFADLGVQTLRYPLLWERVAPDRSDALDWSWTDARLARIRSRGVGVIAGLVHHGAGPHYATLETAAFAPGLAAFASSSARRYPWIDRWTPVNEPLTTARFAALYGLWYPHARNETVFWAVLLNEIDAIRLAMREIRKVNSAAELVQTEDLGCTYATARASDQAAFDNARRWMTWDLLFGRVTSEHPLWLRLTRLGFGARLQAIADDPCPPQIVGINHYLTSDRFLDDRIDAYPDAKRGGNRFMDYADTEAVRVLQPAPAGLEGALQEAWQRYQAPLAVTEVHNGCTRDEQMRWFAEAWAAACEARDEGIDVRAVTAWSLLGACDWDGLLTRHTDAYEPGAFDVSSGAPRPTALASLLSSYAGRSPAPQGWQGEGWWRRDIRLSHLPVRAGPAAPPRRSVRVRHARQAPLLIVGATGTLGRMLARTCQWRGLDYVLASRKDFSLTDENGARRFIKEVAPRAVLNAAGWVRVDEAEGDPEGCRRDNVAGAMLLADICEDTTARLVTFSSDLVFDGAKRTPYVETDACAPLCVYGASKYEAERAILERGDRALIVRTSSFFSPYDAHNFAVGLARELAAGRPFLAASDVVMSPTFVPDLANAVLDLVIDTESGIWHLANKGAVSWADFAIMIAEELGLNRDLVIGRRNTDLGLAARRPGYSALGSLRGALLPSLDDAVARFAAAVPHQAQHTPEAFAHLRFSAAG